ncbi:hypothetical protein LH51_19095 [Nitrincola sp. A-D6]|uniref:hypothetical protein n=1 Tax=Nitrincola sp. A-D6 TaxID=1545442 RepID=UPI00051FD2ED|nr:hypothetical protein [Nitrincola sp. A-D6]KGK40864.1 hypothetical protein LH51_19095 [Nitrincola sp. A-D6]
MAVGDARAIKRAALSFLILVLGMLWAPVAVLLDVEIIVHGMPELSATEISQGSALLLSTLLMYTMVIKLPSQRGFLLLVAGLFLSMFLRELDYLFDKISHGFWKYPVACVVLLTFALAALFRKSVVPAMAEATRSVPFAYILAGLAVVLFFSRVFGTGSFWEAILDAGANVEAPALVKNAVQEGLELLGYVLVLYGSVLFFLQHRQPVQSELDL